MRSLPLDDGQHSTLLPPCRPGRHRRIPAGVDGVWAHALRQADGSVANLTGGLGAYQHKDGGAVASLGLREGVAELYGVPVRGFLAWLVHRLYHGSRLPCSRRRLLVNLVWLLGSRSRDPVAVSAIESPRAPLRDAIAAQDGRG